ncbi:MAG: radical SAM protein [Intestinibacillus sp.]
MADLSRYAIIRDKNPREIVLLRGSGCKWRRCRFCDYHLDFSRDQAANLALNREVLSKVTGQYGRLEAINSGSFTDLDAGTIDALADVCINKGIRALHVECHWRDREAIPALRARFAAQGTEIRVKLGVETFDARFRESYLDKGIDEQDPAVIAAAFDECCLLAGLPGQTADSMMRDIETGLRYFGRVCVNVMTENSAPVQPDPAVREIFAREVAPHWTDDPRVDILLHNTDFGVGGRKNEE